MIIFFEYGRLGNQLFQYCGFRQYFHEHKLLFVGCEDLQRYFDCDEVRFIPKAVLWRWLPFRILRTIVFLLVAARFLGRITEERDGENYRLAVRKGLFWNTYVPHNVFFQHRDVINRIQCTPHLKSCLINAAYEWLKRNQIDISSDSLVFVHVRRGDYLNWPSKDSPAVLDLSWYKRAIETLQEEMANPVFVLMSDDLFYLRDVFGESDEFIISDNRPAVDLAIMSICHSGILSASSFAWWGAFMARSDRARNGTFLAPLYWAGHRAMKWHPTGFRTDWITYQE